MSRRFRVIDTGQREGRANIAFDSAMIEAHKAGDIPDTVRFLRFPPTVLIGRHQALSHEVRLEHCRANGIGVVRRITGGGAIYMDENQLGWELVFRRASLGFADLAAATAGICEAVAAGLGRLGLEARFRPRNDIEVGGRKICGTGGFFDGDTLIYQGTLLIDTDTAAMVAALNVPEAKLAKRGLDSAAQRVVTMRELLGPDLPELPAIRQALLDGLRQRLDIDPVWGDITQNEETLAARIHDQEIGTDAFVHEIDEPPTGADTFHASHAGPGGTVTAYLRLEGPARNRIREVLLTGDFFVTPPRMVFDLEASLRGVPVDGIADAVAAFFHPGRVQMLSLTADDFRTVIEAAASQRD